MTEILFFHFSDVAFFASALEKYHGQVRMAQVIKEKRPIGMLLIDGTKMKSLLNPSPTRCLDVRSEIQIVK